MRITLLRFLLCCLPVLTSAQANSKLLDSIFKAHPELKKVIDAKSRYRPQIIYTQINRDSQNKPSFKNHSYYLDSTSYFYCASLVKLPCSIMALEKINQLDIKGLTRSTTMLTDSAGPCQRRTWTDTSAMDGLPSIEHHIKKMLLVSDNVSYSRIFEFLTPKYIQNRFTELGHPSARIIHRFDVQCIGAGNRYFNPISFVNEYNQPVYNQPADSLNEEFKPPLANMVLGKDIYSRKKRLIHSKKDFSKSNYLSLQMIHEVLRDLVFNEYRPKEKQFRITNNDWEFLMKHLGMYPRESEWPRYHPKTYYDSYKKYFIYGSSTPVIESDTLRIFNIVGRAYGFIVDCAYIIDKRTNTEFMLSTSLFCNRRNSFGSGIYEFDTVGLPFLKELSLALYSFEKARKKKHEPKLDNLNFYKKD